MDYTWPPPPLEIDNADTPGDYTLHDITNQLQRKKQGGPVIQSRDQEDALGTKNADGTAKPICSDENGDGEGLDCVRIKQRRYLTDPPTAYRIPAESAPHGENAFSEEEIQKRKKAEKDAKAEAMGVTRKSTVVWE